MNGKHLIYTFGRHLFLVVFGATVIGIRENCLAEHTSITFLNSFFAVLVHLNLAFVYPIIHLASLELSSCLYKCHSF